LWTQTGDGTINEAAAVLSLHWPAQEGAGRLSRAAQEGGGGEIGVSLVEKTPERGTVWRWADEDGQVGVHSSEQRRCLWFGCAASNKQLCAV
jgi:hypothetical protein